MLEAPTDPGQRYSVHRLRVTDVEPLTTDSVAITLDVPEDLAEAFAFRAGQHVAIERDEDGARVRRSYSICSAEGGPLRIGIKRREGGRFSTFAHSELAVGASLDVLPPAGRFTLPDAEAPARHVAAVAAGSGITPVMSILATLLEQEPHSRCSLIYGNRSASTIMFLEQLQDLKSRFAERVSIVHVLSREPGSAPLFEGRIDAAKVAALLDGVLDVASIDAWFLCGPMAMVDEVRGALRTAGAPGASIHRELFHAEDAVPTTPAAGVLDTAGALALVSVTLDGRTTELHVGETHASILDALLEVRPDAPYACKGGVCGTCRCRLVEGDVEMHTRYALEDDEVAAGLRLACQSRARSERVVLDFDGV
jgi:ring-1,2-phenylacetyl-CoA epoxidase subunit PaaE